MGIKFNCPQGHKLNVKSFLAGRRGICPHCDVRFRIPMESGGTAELIVKGDRSKGDATRLTAEMQDQPQSGAAVTATQATVSPAGMAQAAAAGTFTENVGANPQAASAAAGYSAPTSSDPISENPNAVWYVRPRSGGQYGPAAGDILREWINEGRVAGDSLVWCEGWPDWRQASSVFPQLAGAVSFPSPVPSASPVASAGGATAGNVSPTTAVGAAVPTAGAIPMGSAIPAGGSSTTGGDAYGAMPNSTAKSSNVSRGAVRRKSGSFTALIVVILVLVAIVLAGVFAWILFGQPENSTAWQHASLPSAAAVTQFKLLF